VKVTLSWLEVFQAACAGSMRRIDALKYGRVHRYGEPSLNFWGVDIEGAAAEMAFAKLANTYWHSIARRPEELPGDVGTMQVRCTQREDGCLILHPEDDDDACFYLLTGQIPTFTVRGWIFGADGKRQEFWRTDTGRPAYFVPQSVLCSTEDQVAA
jgi:hypothetical protein